jgi:hypothetical protein
MSGISISFSKDTGEAEITLGTVDGTLLLVLVLVLVLVLLLLLRWRLLRWRPMLLFR